MEPRLAAGQASISGFAEFAQELARAARRETLARFCRDCAVEDKGDGLYDPVTDADRAAEQAMRAMIEHAFPDHGIAGEEFGTRGANSAYSWSLDPIDGTRSYVCGLPTWTTLIALLENGRPILGLIDSPVLDETYFGCGDEAWLLRANARTPLGTSCCTSIPDARLSTTDPFLLHGPGGFDRVRRAAKLTRFGHDGYAYARLAAGTLDLVIESGLKAHDYNPLVAVVTAAGGHIGDWGGGSEFASGNVIAAATGELYEAAVALLAE
jgi:histidinol phosphatase-like enzyme (inositol monophosphatase family)